MNEGTKKARARQHVRQGYEHQCAGRLGYALHEYRRSIALHPTAEAYTLIGRALSLMGRFQEAIDQCRHAIALDPDYGDPYSDIGAYLVELERWQEAEIWLEMALNTPRYESRYLAHYHLGRVHQHFARYQEAYACYRAALAEDSSHEPSQEALISVITQLN